MNVIIFGFGETGKKLVDECLDYECDIHIVAIVDNNIIMNVYRDIIIVTPDKISLIEYDEIWISTVYFKEIIFQLLELGINQNKMRFVESVVPILEYRLIKSGLLNDNKYYKEATYIKDNHLRMYPYSFYDEYINKDSEIFYDTDAELFFGIYKNHRMYLARRFNSVQKARAYFNAVTMEQDKRSPHCYWNNESFVNQFGCAVDVGAAEGIYGLQIIDQVDYLYMIEADEEWIEALQYTFKDYLNKVEIINKYIGNSDFVGFITLDTLFNNKIINSIKIDIEGSEMDALLGAKKLLNQKLSLAICVYHHKDDNKKISEFLSEYGYSLRNSSGYVVCQGTWELEKDEVGFRRALLFAERT